MSQPNEKPESLNLKCPNKKCKSITAIQLQYPAKGTRMYQCTECKRTWPITVGGQINLSQI